MPPVTPHMAVPLPELPADMIWPIGLAATPAAAAGSESRPASKSLPGFEREIRKPPLAVPPHLAHVQYRLLVIVWGDGRIHDGRKYI